MVQWLRLCASTAGGTGLIPAQGAKVLCAAWCGQKIKKKEIKLGEEINEIENRKTIEREFPGGPVVTVVRTLCFHCRGSGN